MADQVPQISAGSLIAAVAQRAKVSSEEVRAVLNRHGISYRPSIAVPRRLCVRSLAFTGEKKGRKSGPISFVWDDLGPGLLAITSGRNFRGKSTLLGLLRWCMNGRRGSNIPSEMAEWFHTVTMRFTLDDQPYEVEIADAVACSGTLWRVDGTNRQEQASFASEQDFEDVMSEFFMGQLGLQAMVTHAVRGNKGTDQPHDWAWLSGAMVIEPDPDALFGAAPHLGTRMMQMYLGLPWVNATNDLMAAQSRLTAEARQATTDLDRSRDRRKSRVAELESEITDLRGRLEKLPSEDKQREALRTANVAFADAERRVRGAVAQLALAADDLEAAKESHARARRDLQDFKDGRAAQFVFRSLEPVCCPRCDIVFEEDRKQDTKEKHVCLVCGTDEPDEGDPAPTEATLKVLVGEAEAVLEGQRKRQNELQETAQAARADMKTAEQDCARIEQALAAPSETRSLEIEILRKEAQRDELTREETGPTASNGDQKILKLAETVTKDGYKPLQKGLLEEVSGLIRDYAILFGMESLEAVDLKANTNLFLVKGGVNTSFSKQTAGEKARLKVAATLALIKVAERRGLGRHPGLLLVDSPGASEMVGEDYAELVARLAQLSNEFSHVQIFMAAVDSPIVRQHVPRERMRYAEGDAYLW